MQPLDVVFDARCFQTPVLRDRGIGRHANSIVRHAREILGASYDVRLLAVTDKLLAPLPGDIATFFDEVRFNSYTGALTRPTWFIELSPMTHDPLFVARLLDHPEILTAAIVYDFIPEEDPDRYLPNAAAKLDYALAKYWLAHFDLFWPISRTSAHALQARAQVPDAHIAVTGASINVDLGPLDQDERASHPPKHILVAGGAEPRKNVESAIRAHARSALFKRQHIPLVVSGAYPDAWCSELRTLYRDAGGTPELLVLPGFVSGDALLKLYQAAYCVLVPSRYEGFSLPVVEAMAAGAPVAASCIAAHQELISSPQLLFLPDGDDDKIVALIERFVSDAGFRASTVRGQETVWPQFLDRNVSGVAWNSIMTEAAARSRRPPAAMINRGHRPKVAVMTPLLPDQTGIAHFAAPFLAELGQHVDLHVFTETQSALAVPAAASVRPLVALPSVSARFDRILGVMGNSEFHVGIFNALARYGGACVAHDARLIGFYWSNFGEKRASRVAELELGRTLLPGEIQSWLEDESRLEALFLGELAEACTPIFLHSSETAELVKKRYGRPTVHLPFPIYRQWSEDQFGEPQRQAARIRLGLDPGEITVVTFGMLHQTKAPRTIIGATALLRAQKIPAKLYFVGRVIDKSADSLRALSREMGIEPDVRIIDQFVSEERYRDYLLAADFGIQLRTHSFGGISGALQDCISAGLPTVANENLCEAIEAPDYVVRVPNDADPASIADAIAGMIDANKNALRFSGERKDYYRDHNFAIYTRRMLEAQGIEVAAGRSQ